MNPALRDVRVRRALGMAIDRDVIVDRVLKGGQWPAYNFTHFKTAGFDDAGHPRTPGSPRPSGTRRRSG